MTRTINSSAQVPREMYVERAADIQIKRIIAEMARPGYVLVARQMGKTNLLLHTKDLLQDNKNIFVYIDFSTMSNYTERECLNTLIDTAIEVNYELFNEAEAQIEQIREKSTYNALRMFNRELRILLKYVDKIVFILDEIDALLRTEYSDRIFSLIRGHYYANANFPELKRATYIMSGVVEPKDIIKDPNISPFNIGEKIYMTDFTYEEFLCLTKKSDYLCHIDRNIIERLYYWTKGQPRMSWDLCVSAEQQRVTSIEEIDDLVKKMYLTTYDRAPIDSIREKIKLDSELCDALIQLSIDKGDSLSDDVKSKLYLAGIIDYKQTIPEFKNPVLAKSLTYDWLLAIHNQELNYLSVADKSIHLERDYKKAIAHLKKFFDSNPTDLDDIDKANFLMGEAYFRTYRTDDSLKYLNEIIKRGTKTKFHHRSMLLRGYTLASDENFKEAEKCFRDLLQDNTIRNTEVYFKAILGLVDVLVSQDDTALWKEAEVLLNEQIEKSQMELLKQHLLATVFYYLACIEEKRKNKDLCVSYIESALQSSQLNERPQLLYMKLRNVKKETRDSTAYELYNSLETIKARPEPEDFDNTLGFNLFYASQILALLMLEYPQYDITKYLRFFLYESKENAVIYIYELLVKNEDEKASDFFKLIVKLVHTQEWLFDLSQRCKIALHQLREYNNPDECLDIISNLNNSQLLQDFICELFSTSIYYFIRKRAIREADQIIKKYRSVERYFVSKQYDKDILIDYYECFVLFIRKDYAVFSKKGALLLEQMISYNNQEENFKEEQLSIDDVRTITENLKKWLQATEETLRKMGIKEKNTTLSRNSKIIVRYISNNKEIEGKYKQLEADLNMGLCIVVKITKL
ncbi:AAA-like domain-containing protein [Phocaeicola coprocola]|uniref:AAA-like domain-containing protein n=1 Tax=Phocaeicola coprocola TaxID=310298 RepID=UPI0026DCF0A0|nr:AAA-like domain-containing protein [Phocaeicola coprocola]